MNYTHLIEQLNKASSFDLHRLRVAIDKEIDSHVRLVAIKQRLSIGMKLGYFCDKKNRLVEVTVIECRQKRALIVCKNDNTQHSVPYYMFNLDGVDTDIHRTTKTDHLTANNLRVGDRVGFNREGESIVGVIKRLNQKTVTLVTQARGQWRVAYHFLYEVYDGEAADAQLVLAHKE